MDTAASIPDLRPLSFSELLDRTFTYYRRHFWLFLGIMAIPQVFILAMQMCLDAIQRLGAGAAGGDGGPEGAEALGAMGGFFLGLILMVVLYWLLYSVALGATTFAISEVHLGRTPSARESYRSMKGRIRRIVDLVFTVGLRVGGLAVVPFIAIVALGVGLSAATGNNLVAGGIVIVFAFLGMIGGAVAAVWMILRYGLCIPALLLEKLTVKEAIRRSIFLTKGNLGRVFLVLLLMTLVAATVGGLVQAPFYVGVFIYAAKGQGVPPLWLSLPMNVVGGVAKAVTSPLLMIGLALLYYDARVRKEGLDIQLIMDALDQRAPQPAPHSALTGPDAAPQLEESSVLLTILLTFVTLYFYYPLWFILRRRALNSLRSSEKIGRVMPLVALGAWSAGMLVSVIAGVSSGMSAGPQAKMLETISNVFLLCFGILNLLLAFKVRRILLDHSESQQAGIFASNLAMEQQSSFSSVATFFFGIFYLQYKINRFVEEWTLQARSAASDASPQPF